MALAMPAGQRPADLIRSRLWSSEPELSSQILRSQQFFETKFLYANEVTISAAGREKVSQDVRGSFWKREGKRMDYRRMDRPI